MKIVHQEDSDILRNCATCYACEEYCPNNNHPFYQIVDLQEKRGVLPAPLPIIKQQVIMMQGKGDLQPQKKEAPLINMCAFPMLTGCIRGKLFEGASTIASNDIFCNIMWLHFARNSVIRERVPKVIDKLQNFFLAENKIDEMVCFHDECYGTYTQLAPAFGIEVPFRSIHLFEYLNQRLDALKDSIRPLNVKIAYQRPCSNRLVPETDAMLDDIFRKIGAERADRKYDRKNTLCCGGVLMAHQRHELVDEIQEKNINDMVESGATFVVFNCPFCMFTLGEAVAERGLMPILVSDLCQTAIA